MGAGCPTATGRYMGWRLARAGLPLRPPSRELSRLAKYWQPHGVERAQDSADASFDPTDKALVGF